MDVVSRYRGSMLGLAAGDALGTTLEFKPPGTFKPITTIVGGGPFLLKAGQWTDDTSMALCLAESLIEKRAFDPVDQMKRYVRWWRHGHMSCTGHCFDIGNTVRSALMQFEKTQEPFCGSSDPATAGNGSIMRLAPVALFFANDSKRTIEYAAESSRCTHAAAEALDACRFFAALIVAALNGRSKEQILGAATLEFFREQPLAPRVSEIACGSYRQKMPPQIRGSGYVVESLEAALWAFHRSQSFAEGARLAVNLGHDADTTGAVYGQLAGAYYGDLAIPDDWRYKLALRDMIETMANNLFSFRALQ